MKLPHIYCFFFIFRCCFFRFWCMCVYLLRSLYWHSLRLFATICNAQREQHLWPVSGVWLLLCTATRHRWREREKKRIKHSQLPLVFQAAKQHIGCEYSIFWLIACLVPLHHRPTIPMQTQQQHLNVYIYKYYHTKLPYISFSTSFARSHSLSLLCYPISFSRACARSVVHSR